MQENLGMLLTIQSLPLENENKIWNADFFPRIQLGLEKNPVRDPAPDPTLIRNEKKNIHILGR